MVQEAAYEKRRASGSRFAAMLAAVLALCLAVVMGGYATPAYAASKTVSTPSPDAITNRFIELGLDNIGSVSYAETPSVKAPYKLGALSVASQQQGVNMLNWIRYVAGVPSNVTLDASYAEEAQGASLVNAINNELSHNPAKPAGMSDEMYQICSRGAGRSNISCGFSGPAYSVLAFADDSDSGNISRVGHRRWCLNPVMGKTGFGVVNSYGAMYAFDSSNTNGYGYDMVLWPAANMPTEIFDNSQAWSVGTRTDLLGDDIKVTLKRLSDGRVWNFSSSSSNGDFYIDTDYYYDSSYADYEDEYANYGDAIIFRPANIEDYSDGDKFQVTVAGSKASKTYTVQFFQMFPDEQTGTWQSSNGKWWFKFDDGGYARGWYEIDGGMYYFDNAGWMQTGWLKYGGEWYYFTPGKGAMVIGWTKIGNTWYYFDGSGTMKTGWQKIGGKWYYLNSSGAMATGWAKVGGKWYYLAPSNGVMATGWTKVGSSWYYLNGSGVMQTGWLGQNGKWYYLNGLGVMATGWAKVGSSWYYLNGSGVMQTGWQKIGSSWYYLNNSGAMATGWAQIGGSWYYLRSSGVMAANVWVGDYYLRSNGVMATNCWIGNYYVGADGKWIRGYGSNSATSPKPGVVYWTTGGDVYHTTRDCVSLKRSTNIKSGTIAQSGKSRACNLCG